MSSPGQRVEREFVVDQKGTGRPDFSDEVFRAAVNAGYELAYGETYKYFGIGLSDIPSPFSWVKPVLAVSGVQNLIDMTTGLAMPYTVPSGYSLRFMSDLWSFSRALETRTYLYGFYYGSGFPDSLNSYYYNIIGGLNTEMIDPTFGAIPFMQQLVNPSPSVTAEGTWIATYILRAEGTPPLSDKKTVKCKYCDYTETIGRTEVKLECKTCGQVTMYLGEPLKDVRLTTSLKETS